MATTIEINTLPATTGYAKTDIHLTLSGADAEKLDRIRLGLIVDTKSVTGSSSTLVTSEDALRFMIQEASSAT
jgi:hypothetical protein